MTAETPPPDPATKAKAPAGWYPHPSMADTQRYWDGETWTDHIAPGAASPVSAPQQSADPRHWVGALTIAGALALVGWLMSDAENTTVSDSGGMVLALGAIIAVLSLLKLGTELMRRD